MSTPTESYAVGYARPPEQYKWKKGQCGNPNRIRKRAPTKSVPTMVDEFLASEKVVVENGVRQRRSAFEIIVSQLLNKAIAGDRRAIKVLAEYRKYAATTCPTETPFIAVLVDDDGNPIKPD